MAGLKPYSIACLEQPLPHEQLGFYRELRQTLQVPIMLDESLTSWIDVQQALQHDACDYFNLRISKCGGMIRCWRMAAFAQRQGVGYQLGCHPGETGVLSAAGRHWAQGLRGIRFLEGSYDRHLLRENIIRENVTFGFGGIASPITKPGLGVTVDKARVERITKTQIELPFATH